MSNKKPSVTAEAEFYSTPNTKFLQNINRVATTELDWNSRVATIVDGSIDGIDFENNLNKEDITKLWNLGNQSKVGKGKNTEEDLKVRKSKEISKNIKLDRDFFKKIKKSGKNLVKSQLFENDNLSFDFYKMVVYQPGDHFKWHIDSNHKNNMIATMSVQLHITGDNKGGDLIISNRDNVLTEYECDSDDDETLNELYEDHEKILTPSYNKVSIAVFYHDTPHMVSKVEEGYRISLIFDITHDPKIETPIESPSFKLDLVNLRAQGVKRVGFLCNHLYMGEKLHKDMLKGSDKYGYKLLQNYAEKVELVEFVKVEKQYIRKELFPLLTYLDMAVWCPVEYNLDEICELSDKLIETKSSKNNNPIDFKPTFDEGLGKAICDEYRLGDVLFFNSDGPARLIYYGDTEVHLGNEGFYGSIYEQVVVIATL